MKKTGLLFIVIFSIIGCSKQSELSKIFNCSSTSIKNTKSISDFNKNFKLSIPTNWKTDLYFDQYQSELFTADTTKQLLSTYILDASFNFGILNFDEAYYTKIDSVLEISKLQKINSGNLDFNNKPAYWYVAKGQKNNYNYHQFNITLKLSENTYFNSYSEIYGDENVDERICESIAILESLEFVK